MNNKLLNNDVQQFIDKNLNNEPTKLILSGSPFPGISIQEIVEQIVSKKKCQKKLPAWFDTKEIYYPNKLNIEQTSSEITANYKSSLISGSTLIDITGGFGVDSFFFSKNFDQVIHCEINPELSKIVHHNYHKLQIENVTTIATNGLDYLDNNDVQYDWIYADPSRRDENKGKVFLLEDCLPDIPSNLDKLFHHTDHILLKLSPILDITATVNALKFIKEIHVVALHNEVKELLFILEKNYKETPIIKTVNIKNDRYEEFEAKTNTMGSATYSLVKNYLYEPNAAILKAGLFQEVSHQLKIDKLHINSHLYTSDILMDFPGRIFKIFGSSPYDKKKIIKLLPSKKANITTRNFPNTVAQIRKKTGIKEGGHIYLFFTTDLNNNRLVLFCEKL